MLQSFLTQFPKKILPYAVEMKVRSYYYFVRLHGTVFLCWVKGGWGRLMCKSCPLSPFINIKYYNETGDWLYVLEGKDM